MKKTEAAIQRCKTMSALQKILGGKWKLEILYYISFCGVHRFGALRRRLGEITESSLTKQLRLSDPPRLQGDSAPCGIHPVRFGQQLYGCHLLYEGLGGPQPAGGAMTFFLL